MKLRTWIALGLLVVGVVSCGDDRELRELKNEDGWILGTVIPFDGNELVIPYRPGEPRKLAILECDPQGKCEVLTVDPLGGQPGINSGLFYPVDDGLVFNVSDFVYHYRPQQGTLTRFELTVGGGGVLYVIDGIVHIDSQRSGYRYDLATGEYLGSIVRQEYQLQSVFASEEEKHSYIIWSQEITNETRAYYEKLLNLTPVDDFGRPIEE